MGNRFDDVYMGSFDIRTWDEELTTEWERILYIEYCSWAGLEFGITFSMQTLARKFAKTSDKSERTILNNLKEARKALYEKGIIADIKYKDGTLVKGRFGTKRIYLKDTMKTRALKMYKYIYSKLRKDLYKKEIDEDIMYNKDELDM